MAKVSFSKKAWVDAAPDGLKNDGLGDALATFLKLLPGGAVDGLKTDAACQEADKGVGPLRTAMKKAGTAVEAVEDAAEKADKKAAAKKKSPVIAEAAAAQKLLKDWLAELDKVEAEIAARQVEIAEDLAAPVLKKWSVVAKGFEPHVLSAVAAIKKVDNQLSHSEQMRQEALMEMVDLAGKLMKTGHTGEVPKDFLDDSEFKGVYKAWDEQIDLYVTNAKARETQIVERKGFVKMLREARGDVDEAIKDLGDAATLKSRVLDDLKDLKKDLGALVAAIEGGKFQSFDLILAVDDQADQARKFAELDLEREFKRMDKGAAELYFRKGFEKRGLDKRLLAKTAASAEDLLKRLKSRIGKSEEGELPKDVLKEVVGMRDELKEMSQSFKAGRNDMDILQALSKDVNAKEKTRIDDAGKIIEDAAAAAVALVRDAMNIKIGGHR